MAPPPRDGGPLSGFRVVDFTENMAGPFGTMILGDQGADVIKVESLRGDAIRSTGTSHKGMSAYFANLNRSKRSIALDLRRAETRDLVESLVDTADVVVHSFRPAAAERLGVDAPTLTRGRPALVHASIVGFGTEGPFAGRAVYDHVIQAVSGMADLQGAGGEPSLVRHGLVDKSTGFALAQAICAALLRRSRTARGESVTVNMLDTAIAFLWPDGMMNHTIAEPDEPGPPAAATYRLTPTKDGHVAMMTVTPSQWQSLIDAFELHDAGTSRGEILRAARRRLAELTTDEAVEALTAHDLACGPVVRMDDVADHPQVRANGILREAVHPLLGSVRQPRPAPVMDGVDPAELRFAPVLGEHTEEVLTELGVSGPGIRALADSGAIGCAGHDPARPRSSTAPSMSP